MQTAKTAPTIDGTKTLLEAIVSIELSHPSVVHTYKFDTIPVTVSPWFALKYTMLVQLQCSWSIGAIGADNVFAEAASCVLEGLFQVPCCWSLLASRLTTCQHPTAPPNNLLSDA